MEEAVADLLNRSLTIDHSQPLATSGSGDEYEVIGQSGLVLPPRPPCPRGMYIISINSRKFSRKSLKVK